MEISLVIPLYNEEVLVEELCTRVLNNLKPVTDQFEIIFVDDGSSDQTLARLLESREKDKRIKILQLSRNFGHQAAFTAGLKHASGSYIGMMDGDLQDPPEKLPEMIKLLQSGAYDVVYGKRDPSGNIGRANRSNRWFHRIFKRISGMPELYNTGNFSFFNRKALESLLEYQEFIRYLPGLRHQIGYRQGYVEYHRDERRTGTSKMPKSKLISLSSDAIFSFSKFPIRFCLYLGILGVIVFFFAGLYTIIAKIAGFALLGWSSTLLSIFFLGSVQLTFLGILGEYVYRIYKESQRRPIYFVKEFHE